MLPRNKYTLDLDRKRNSAFSFQFNSVDPTMFKPFFGKRRSSITLSDSSFSQKITKKYQQSKTKRLPTMIFFNRKQSFLLKKFNVDFLIQFHPRNRIEKEILQFIQMLIIPKSVQVISNPAVTSILSKTSLFRFANTAFQTEKEKFYSFTNKENIWKYQPALQASFFRNTNTLLTTAFNPQAYTISSGKIVKRKLSIYNDDMLILNQEAIPLKSIAKSVTDILCIQRERLFNFNAVINKHPSARNIENYQLVIPTKYITRHMIGILGEVPEKTHSIIVAKPIIKQEIFKYSPSSSSFTSLQESYAFKDSVNFYFQDNRKIEQVLDHVNKVAVEVKEKLTGKSMPGDELRQFDINQISDKVYQMIDYRLKIEKERRSHL